MCKVTNYFWKKEYQARSAPHYHVLLWIESAPVIGVNGDNNVIKCINERIMCHILNNPELHKLVSTYEMHICSAYCKKTLKVKGTYVTLCTFNFPTKKCLETKINHVKESLKSNNKIYLLACSKIRINNYNPLTWKDNNL